jgi:hypothetical protein
LEKEEFINMMIAVRQSTAGLPTRKALRISQLDVAQQLHEKVIDRLKAQCVSAPVTIAVDGWTNVRHDKVNNVIPLCAGRAYYWTSIVNTLDRNTAEWLHPRLVESFGSLISKGILIVAMVADNEEVNNSLYNRMHDTYPFLVQVPCAAHTLQLIVKKILKLNGVSTVISSMNDILNAFMSSKENRLKLKNLQLESGATTIYSLVRPNDTRWSSSYYAAARMSQLHEFINIVLRREPSFWTGLKSLIDCLKPFQTATDILQSDTATLFDVYSQFCSLLAYIKNVSASHILYAQKNAAEDIILQYWMRHINISAVLSCAVMSFDRSYLSQFSAEQQTAARHWFIDFGVSYISYYHLSDEDNKDSIRMVLLAQYSLFTGRAGIFSALDKDIDSMKQQSIKQHSQRSSSSDINYTYFDPKTVWYLYKYTAPELTSAAVALLSIVPSEAAVERSFSMQDTVHSKRRNRLLDPKVEAEMFIKFNWRAFDSTVTPHGNYIELTEDNIEKETDSVVSLFINQITDSDAESEAAAEEDLHVHEEEHQAAVLPSIDLFIQHYITQNRVTSGYRWSEHRLNHLEAAAAEWEPPIIDTVDSVKKKIMLIVNPRT